MLAGCGAGDSTVSKTPEASTTTAAPATAPPGPPPQPAPRPARRADPCAVNLAAPEIAKAVSDVAARSRAATSPGAPSRWPATTTSARQLSAVIVKANTNADNPNTRAVMFHLGKFIPTGVPDTYGFNGIDETATTGDTVALVYSDGVPGLNSVVQVPLERQRRRADRQHARLTRRLTFAQTDKRATTRREITPKRPFGRS